MLKSLQLRNFQVHESLCLDLAPGITTIRGRTDAGKSAVLRALRWISLNSLVGDAFIRHGSEFSYAVLKIQAPDGTEVRIVRKRGRENIYKLDGRVFKSFGASVPEPIARLLNVNEINFQRQHDSPFWFAASAPEVSRQLNRVIDLAVIDSSLSRSAALVRVARERISVTEARLAEARSRRDELIKSGTRRLEQFRVIQDGYSRLKQAEDALDLLGGILEQLDTYPLSVLQAKYERAKALVEKADALRRVSTAVIRLGGLISQLDEAQAGAVEPPDFRPLERSWMRLDEAEQSYIRLYSIVKALEVDENVVRLCEQDSIRVKAILKRERCPLCGRKN